jgi:hypothetical protein
LGTLRFLVQAYEPLMMGYTEERWTIENVRKELALAIGREPF